MRSRRALTLGLGAALVLFGLALQLPVSSATRAWASVDTISSAPAFTSTETINRDHLNADGTDDVVDTRDFSVTVDRDTELRGNQQLRVTWTGAHPTGGLVGDESSATAARQEEYPVVLMECRGVDSAQVSAAERLDPTTCWTQTTSERYSESGTAFPVWRLDRYGSVEDRAAHPGQPDPLLASCVVGAEPAAARWVPFVAADGTAYEPGYTPNGTCTPLAPEASNVENSGAPGNTTYAVTQADGTGSSKFVVWSQDQNASLGCSETVACSLVVVPIMGISCDVTAADLPTEDRAPAAEATNDDANCRSTGLYGPGAAANPSLSDPTVTGRFWWAASNWRNRVSVPLSFATSPSVCDVVSSSNVVLLYGSEPMAEATQQWAPKFCTDPTKFTFRHVQTSEPAAKNLLGLGLSNPTVVTSGASPSTSASGTPTASLTASASGSEPPVGAPTASNGVEAVLESDAPPDGFTLPTVQAPIAVTGFAISYIIDDQDRHSYTQLRLTPRLLAKLMTESYPDIPAVYLKYPALARNPTDITRDPEFIALNPNLSFATATDAASTLYSLSGDSDTMFALTSYINADPEARAWLNGTPDPWGMVVNPNYKGIALPVDSWPLLDSFIADFGHQGGNNCLDDNPVPYLPLVASPTSSLVTIALALQYAAPLSQTVCVLGGGDTDLGDKLTTTGREEPGFRFMIGLTSLGDAEFYGLDTAQLQTYQVAPDATAQFTSDVGRLFAAPTDAALLAAARLAVPDEASGTWPIPYDALRANPANASAYPGTMFVYAAVPTAALPTADAADLAALIRFAVKQGQAPGFGNGQLPPGYAPMTANDGLGDQVGYALRAAAAVASQNGKVPTLLGGDELLFSAPPPMSPTPASTTPGAPAAVPTHATPGRGVGPVTPTSAVPNASTPATPAISSSVPSSSSVSSAPAVFSGTTVAHSSSLASSVLPSVLAIGLGALLLASGLRFKVKP
jgi:hypothetical protein